jgi:hypothetical protein
MKRILFLCLVTGTLSCSNLKSEKVSYYFSIDSLLVDQAKILMDNNATLLKSAIVNNDTTAATISPDSLQWANELQVFIETDINKPAMKGNYTITIEDDPQSNLMIKSFKAISNKIAVQSLQVYFLEDLSNIRHVIIMTSEKNSIYSADKNLKLDFDVIKNNLRLMSFNVTGYQKMILQDTVNFSVTGKVKY